MYIDLSDLASLADPNMQKRDATRGLVRKGAQLSYAHILSGATISPKGNAKGERKSIKKGQAAGSPFQVTPNRGESSTIGKKGAPNATSNVSGAPKATQPPNSIERLLAAVHVLVVSLATAKSSPSTERIDVQLRKAREDDEATSWNERRSAAQRQGFTFHAAKSEVATVSLGKSAHSVRMSGNKLAPAPTVARAQSSRSRLNDTYWQRSNPKKPEVF